ncbi:sigma-54-dependent Fis family transcriptional regulator [Bacteroides thetaiotaomicron]|nr:sigma-54-dependent Fis family transcriptional regulator [Bacteroides thetaiotaomicron]
MMKSILIIEDDITFGMMLKTWLSKKGFEVSSVSNIARAQKHIEGQGADLILSDLRLPDHDGIDLLKWMNEKGIDIPLIIMTGYADIQSAVQAMKLGARDYVAKPVNPEELLKKMSEALQAKEAPTTHTAAKTSAKKGSSISSGNATETHHAYLEGESDAAKQLYNYVGLVAPTNMSVLINGSSGTGKELAASEFFGHVKGSFTGALTDKTGAFVAANGGTIFLDEIGNLSYEVQIQLLRALQERKIRPVGSTQDVSVDIRLVSATNENLEQAIEKGTFREDLFHRINEFTLRMPDLKERKEDILLFANFFLDQANKELDKHLIGFDSKASQALLNYHWPGNLRQMKNIVKRATLLAQGSFITLLELGTELLETSTVCSASMALRNEETEKEHILEALRQTGNNKSKAAQLLNIDRKTLYNKLKLYNIDL